jgi:hypothetical protein
MNFCLPFSWARRVTLAVAVLLLPTALPAATVVFRDGKVMLPVLVSREAAPEEREAARELGRVLQQISGLAWPVREPAAADEPGFYVGAGPLGLRLPKLKARKDLLVPQPGEISPDGFRVTSVDGSVLLEGATPAATYFAVCWFLQDQAGVRWYAPGPEGEQIPQRSEWVLPEISAAREPAYVSRELTGLATPAERAWGRHNGLGARLEFSHALNRVFSPTVITGHPEWRPMIQGERYEPKSAADGDWQPNIAEPAVAKFAAETVAQTFATEPARASFSLAINDTARFDQAEETRRIVEPLHYFRGRPDYSSLVFTFMNRVATELGPRLDGRYLGGLAYFWCESPPGFALHPRVLPFVAADRSQYYEARFREEDLALMSRWGSSGATAFGLWDYAYGRGFVVPRQPLGALAEALREAWRRGARGYLAELEPHWGYDAFKAWMLTQLLWNPERATSELTTDFFHGYYGAAAAPMLKFFQRCEAQWQTQPGAASWLKFRQQEDQALLFPPTVCVELRAVLEDARHRAEGDSAVLNRVQCTSRAFAVTEAYADFDTERRQLAKIAAAKNVDLKATQTSLQALLGSRARFSLAYAEARRGESPAMADTETAFYFRNDPVPSVLWRVAQEEPIAALRMLETVGMRAEEMVSWRAWAEALAGKSSAAEASLLRNGSFLSTSKRHEPRFLFSRYGQQPAEWTVSAMPTETGAVSVRRGDAVERRRLRIEGAWDSMVYQWVPADPGRGYALTAQFRGSSSPGNESALFLRFLDAEGKALNRVGMQSLPTGTTTEWRTMVTAEVAPENARWVGAGVGATRQATGDWLEACDVALRPFKTEQHP